MTQLARRAAQKVAATFRYFCARCNRETTWRFVTEDARMEYYKCECCNHTRGWAVR